MDYAAVGPGQLEANSQDSMPKQQSTESLTPLSEADSSCLILFSGFHVADYKAELPRHVEGTCNWILKQPKYVTWASERESTLLWLTGHPGCGKDYTLCVPIGTTRQVNERFIGRLSLLLLL